MTAALSFSATAPGTQAPWDESSLATFMHKVEVASAIADPLQRCLHMPDPPKTNWNRDGVAAYCRYHAVPAMTPARFQSLIAQGKGAVVDREFAGYLHAQMTDPKSPGRLDHAMYEAGFHDASKRTRAAIDAWKKQRPDSPFALAASGMQYYDAAANARGGGFAGETSDSQWAGMHANAALARQDFDRAAGMTPAIPSIYADMVGLAIMTSDHAYADSALDRGLAMEPANLSLRLVRAGMTGPKWGGSRALQEDQRTQARALAAANPLMWVVVGRLSIDIEKLDALDAPNDGRPLTELREVPTASDLAHLAGTGRLVGHGEEAMILAVEALRFDSGQVGALEVIGVVGPHQGYAAWTKAALKRAAAEHPGADDVTEVSQKWLRQL
jgi:hypothetical protein